MRLPRSKSDSVASSWSPPSRDALSCSARWTRLTLVLAGHYRTGSTARARLRERHGFARLTGGAPIGSMSVTNTILYSPQSRPARRQPVLARCYAWPRLALPGLRRTAARQMDPV
ncbi:unnamed protein product [Calypogeia fissa]